MQPLLPFVIAFAEIDTVQERIATWVKAKASESDLLTGPPRSGLYHARRQSGTDVFLTKKGSEAFAK